MTNLFLKVNKDLFNLGLNPTEILVLAQIIEFNTNTGDCFISDKALAQSFGVSEKTISRTIKALEDRGLITRDTKNIKGGKERHIKVNLNKIESCLSMDKLSVDSDIQKSNCLVSMDKLTNVNGQNDLIKDNIKDKEKDNILESFSASALKASLNYPVVTVKWLMDNHIEYELIQDSRNLIRIKSTGATVKVV